jgi:hypothetical protein
LLLFDPAVVLQCERRCALPCKPALLKAQWGGVAALAALPITSTSPQPVPLSNYHWQINRSIAWVHRQLDLSGIAKLDTKGTYGYAYMIFKWKHVSKMNMAKVRNGRPLWPMCNAIDNWFMSRCGKLGVALCRLLPQHCMLLHSTADLVPTCANHVAECVSRFGADGFIIDKRAWDISGMYTFMTHASILTACDFVLSTVLLRPGGRSGVFHVSKRGSTLAGIGVRHDDAFLHLSVTQYTHVFYIALAFSFGWFGSSLFLSQVFGTPMGNPMSVFFAKAVTAYASHTFFMSIYADPVLSRKIYVFGTCFIDDLNLFLACARGDHFLLVTKFCELFRRFECGTFPDPLVLEVDDTDTYLETVLRVFDGDIHIMHNTKIDLAALCVGGKTLLRLHAYDSFCPKSMLFGILVGALSRCVLNSSHTALLSKPVQLILREFAALGFPVRVANSALRHVGTRRAVDLFKGSDLKSLLVDSHVWLCD